MIRGFEKYIACAPLKVEDETKKNEKNAVKVGEMRMTLFNQRIQLVPLRVIFGNEVHSIYENDLVYVPQAGTHQSGMVSQWSKSIDVDIGDGKTVEVVMVPIDQIQLVDYKSREPWCPAPTPAPAPGEPRTP